MHMSQLTLPVDLRSSPCCRVTTAVVLHGAYPIPDWMGQPPFTELDESLLPCLQPGTVIFIEGNTKQRFFSEVWQIGVSCCRMPSAAIVFA